MPLHHQGDIALGKYLFQNKTLLDILEGLSETHTPRVLNIDANFRLKKLSLKNLKDMRISHT